LNPATPASVLEYVLELVDLILIMSVNPGFGGQAFIPEVLPKISQIRKLCTQRSVNPWIEVDGGIKSSNAHLVIQAGANALVAGSAVFGATDYGKGNGVFFCIYKMSTNLFCSYCRNKKCSYICTFFCGLNGILLFQLIKLEWLFGMPGKLNKVPPLRGLIKPQLQRKVLQLPFQS